MNTEIDAAATTANDLVIRESILIHAPRERVWRALTDEAELGSWFPKRAELSTGAGAEGWFDWQEQGRYAVRIETFEPPARLVWRWAREADQPVGTGESTVVEWTLHEEADGSTRLELRESGFTDRKAYEGNREGWTEELGELVAYLG